VAQIFQENQELTEQLATATKQEEELSQPKPPPQIPDSPGKIEKVQYLHFLLIFSVS
jgi:hypothetical protein